MCMYCTYMYACACTLNMRRLYAYVHFAVLNMYICVCTYMYMYMYSTYCELVAHAHTGKRAQSSGLQEPAASGWGHHVGSLTVPADQAHRPVLPDHEGAL